MGKKTKIVFFDIDGTLWGRDFVVPRSTMSAIRALQMNGDYAFINSGRAKAYINDPVLLGMGFDGIVAGCGTYVEFGGQVKQNITMSQELLSETMPLLKGFHMPLVLEGPEYLYMDDEDFRGDPFGDVLHREMGDKLIPITGNEGKWIANKMSVNQVAEHFKDVLEPIEPNFEIIFHGNDFMELVPKGYSKATGIQYVCDMLGVDREDTIAFGDSTNDIEMLKYAGVGVAMGNSTADAVAASDFKTRAYDDRGIEMALKHLGII